jgi:LemA protein
MWILDLLAILIVVFGIVFYNILVTKKNRIDQAYYSIDVMLKKRYDLVPMLVDTVKGFMTHERETLESVTQMRSNILAGNMKVDGKVAADNVINTGISHIMLMSESYPVLRSSPNFLHLQGALNESEEQLAASRRFLNAAVTDYHNALEKFPSNIIARIFGMKRRNYFIIPGIEKERPVLYFNKQV